MDRERLHRGKRKDNGEWAKGFYWKDIWGDNTEHIMYDGEDYEVIPETVGEYTGLTDKNGKKIFEGDIVRFNQTIFEIAYIAQYTRFAGRKPKTIMSVFNMGGSEVIGNIHDNPELLEVSE